MSLGVDGYRRMLRLASVVQRPSPSLIPTNAASLESMVFSFRYLVTNYSMFATLPEIGSDNRRKKKLYDSLIAVFNVFRALSCRAAIEIESESSSYSRCHYVHKHDDKRLKSLGLDILKDFMNQNLFQLGINDDKERVIGFFAKDKSNLFEVCFLDLNHDAYS